MHLPTFTHLLSLSLILSSLAHSAPPPTTNLTLENVKTHSQLSALNPLEIPIPNDPRHRHITVQVDIDRRAVLAPQQIEICIVSLDRFVDAVMRSPRFGPAAVIPRDFYPRLHLSPPAAQGAFIDVTPGSSRDARMDFQTLALALKGVFQ
ncbi:MAG: hypothetical protein Q9200_007059, partial [Gallowayella weberi]